MSVRLAEVFAALGESVLVTKWRLPVKSLFAFVSVRLTIVFAAVVVSVLVTNGRLLVFAA